MRWGSSWLVRSSPAHAQSNVTTHEKTRIHTLGMHTVGEPHAYIPQHTIHSVHSIHTYIHQTANVRQSTGQATTQTGRQRTYILHQSMQNRQFHTSATRQLHVSYTVKCTAPCPSWVTMNILVYTMSAALGELMAKRKPLLLHQHSEPRQRTVMRLQQKLSQRRHLRGTVPSVTVATTTAHMQSVSQSVRQSVTGQSVSQSARETDKQTLHKEPAAK